MDAVFDYSVLAAAADERACEYRTAQPFPHIALDAVARTDVLRAAVEAFPRPQDEHWYNNSGRPGTVDLKQTIWDSRKIPEILCRILFEMNSGPFIEFLESLTGIEGLVPDPHFYGAGVHQILPGGTLGVHVDHNLNPRLKLYRRVSAILYLNQDWQDEYKGHLELWSADSSACVARIAPEFGRLVVFTNSETSFHGHPEPLACAAGHTRKSLTSFYLTADPDPSYSPMAHAALFSHA